MVLYISCQGKSDSRYIQKGTSKTLQECETALTLQYETLFFLFSSFYLFVCPSIYLFVLFSSCFFVFMYLCLSVILSFLSFCLFVFLSSHHTDQMSEGSPVSKVSPNSNVAVSQSVTTKIRYRAARAAKNTTQSTFPCYKMR